MTEAPIQPAAHGSGSCTLIGILDDGWAGLGDVARARLASADLIIGARRTLDLVSGQSSPTTRLLPMDGALSEVAGWVQQACADGRQVVVLATGDPLCHGIGSSLAAALAAAGMPSKSADRRAATPLELLPAPSTVQLAFARLKRPWQQAHIASCHGNDRGDWQPGATPEHALYAVLRAVARHPLVAVLTSAENGPDRIARALLTVGHADDLRLSVACRLAREDETIAADLRLIDAATRSFPDPNVVIIEQTALFREQPLFGLADTHFVQQQQGEHAGLITKREPRAVALASLGLHAHSIVWDIGAGSGSVGLEASRIAHQGHVWAMEKSPTRAAHARTNARRLRASNYSLFEGKAPDGLDTWPDPDAVFIGGSGGELASLIELIRVRLRPDGRLAINLIALENLAIATAALDQAGLVWELIQLGVFRSQPILHLHRLAALNPVWILIASLPETGSSR
ncbi:MAG: precorrin-6y C5,15-methyltransferase (decarboxylating) subunit CbiE [Thiohalocapsa sp. PB-PSB1]|jgi:precorrin-6Y C5,15-methyltransferase (decarboxylating)|nr:MAG: hypothetical protein N838_14065 [Thiohalocapsa sp. PB-PSB1]QQO55307.1 MAG: precorrin-6y C5,15-methyltransferase (decarboxylating) subunit CbiE [Thiohalocapsa sp. PB-PSB1]